MAAFVKHNNFVQNMGRKVFNLHTDTLKVVLTNTAPNVATVNQLSDITQIANGNGYTTGGSTAANQSYTQTGGVAKLVADDVVFTAAGGTIGPFRYAVLYDDTATNDETIGHWDYGSAITLQIGDTFTVDFDGTNGIATLT